MLGLLGSLRLSDNLEAIQKASAELQSSQHGSISIPCQLFASFLCVLGHGLFSTEMTVHRQNRSDRTLGGFNSAIKSRASCA